MYILSKTQVLFNIDFPENVPIFDSMQIWSTFD